MGSVNNIHASVISLKTDRGIASNFIMLVMLNDKRS